MGARLGRGGGRGRAPRGEGSQVALEGGGQRLALEALAHLQDDVEGERRGENEIESLRLALSLSLLLYRIEK